MLTVVCYLCDLPEVKFYNKLKDENKRPPPIGPLGFNVLRLL